jgi:photosystem II stability/assembly factor-like uncharacterized protein
MDLPLPKSVLAAAGVALVVVLVSALRGTRKTLPVPQRGSAPEAATREPMEKPPPSPAPFAMEAWTPLKIADLPDQGQLVMGLAIDPATPSTVYAAIISRARSADGNFEGPGRIGVYKTVDSGDTWSSLPSNFHDLPSALAVAPAPDSAVYLGLDGGEIWRTTDGGASWTRPSSQRLAVHQFAFDPGSPPTLYAASWDSGVLRSTDRGGSWTDISKGLAGPHAAYQVSSVAVVPDSPSTLLAGTRFEGVFRSTNGGSSWAPVGEGLPKRKYGGFEEVSSFLIPRVSSSSVWVHMTAAGLYKTVDRGTSWTSVISTWGSQQAFPGVFAIDPLDPATFYAGTSEGVFKSSDGGASWNPANDGLYRLVSTLAIAPASPRVVYAGTVGYGVYRSRTTSR